MRGGSGRDALGWGRDSTKDFTKISGFRERLREISKCTRFR